MGLSPLRGFGLFLGQAYRWLTRHRHRMYQPSGLGARNRKGVVSPSGLVRASGPEGRHNSIPDILRVTIDFMFLKQSPILILKGLSSMMFHLVLYVLNHPVFL